jgi:hypothetical protein
MTTDKEIVKSKIRELASKIKDEEEEWLWESYELEIAILVIDYSIRNKIKIPLIDYDLYSKVRPEPIEEKRKPILKRKQIDDINNQDKDEDEYFYRENHIFFDHFLEAIGEEGLTNPRFLLHSDIRELVDCWNVE